MSRERYSALMGIALTTTNTCLCAAIDHIDEQLGEGYAGRHPELLAAYMQTTVLIAGSIESHEEKEARRKEKREETFRQWDRESAEEINQ